MWLGHTTEPHTRVRSTVLFYVRWPSAARTIFTALFPRPVPMSSFACGLTLLPVNLPGCPVAKIEDLLRAAWCLDAGNKIRPEFFHRSTVGGVAMMTYWCGSHRLQRHDKSWITSPPERCGVSI